MTQTFQGCVYNNIASRDESITTLLGCIIYWVCLKSRSIFSEDPDHCTGILHTCESSNAGKRSRNWGGGCCSHTPRLQHRQQKCMKRGGNTPVANTWQCSTQALFIQQAVPTPAFEEFNDPWLREPHKNEKSPRNFMKAFWLHSYTIRNCFVQCPK